MMNYLHKLKWISTSTTCHVHLHSKANYLYAHLQGEPLSVYEDNTHKTELSHTFIPIENFNQYVINYQKGGDCKCI